MKCNRQTKRCVIGWCSVTGVLTLVSLIHIRDYTAVYGLRESFWGLADSTWNMSRAFSERSTISQPRPPAPGSPVILLIMAYMHTGSSYTGSIFQQHPGTYYEYESLRSLQHDSREGQTIHYMNGTYRRLQGWYIDPDVATHAVINMFTCQHQNLDLSTLTTFFQKSSGLLLRDKAQYKRCIIQYRQSEATTRWNIVRNCLPLLKNKCRSASIRVFKFIRMGVTTVEQILAQDASVKIIHLVRDPRAMLNSQVRKNNLNSRNSVTFDKNARDFCTRMLFNLENHVRLRTLYPDQIVILRYEDLVEQPIAKAREMFKFINVPFTAHDKSFITTKSIETAKNSTTRAEVWRHSITTQQLTVVNKYCSPVYELLGYIKYSKVADIRNISKPTFLQQYNLHSLESFG